MCWVSVTYSGFLLLSLIAPFTSDQDHVKRFTNGCLPSPSVHCLISVGRIGTLSGQIRSWFTMRTIQIRSESDWKRNNRYKFWLLSWLYKKWYFFNRVWISWSDFWQILIGNGPIKDGIKNSECVTEAYRGCSTNVSMDVLVLLSHYASDLYFSLCL